MSLKLFQLIALLMTTFFAQNVLAKNYGSFDEKKCTQIVDTIEKKGNYEWVSSLSCGEALIGVVKNQKYGFVNTHGDIVIPLNYDNVTFFNSNSHLIGVEKQGKWGFVNHKNKIIIPFQYDDVYCMQEGCDGFFNGLVSVKKNGKWGVINTKNQTIIPFEYDAIGSSKEFLYFKGKIRVSKNDKWGAINNKNQVIIPLKNEWIDGDTFEITK